jgi:WD40 repeat protein
MILLSVRQYVFTRFVDLFLKHCLFKHDNFTQIICLNAGCMGRLCFTRSYSSLGTIIRQYWSMSSHTFWICCLYCYNVQRQYLGCLWRVRNPPSCTLFFKRSLEWLWHFSLSSHSLDRIIKICNRNDTTQLRLIKGFEGIIKSLAFDPNRQFLVSLSSLKSSLLIILFDVILFLLSLSVRLAPVVTIQFEFWNMIDKTTKRSRSFPFFLEKILRLSLFFTCYI